MIPFVNELITGFGVVLSWPVILFAVVGTLLGLFFGVIPGLGGTVALALLLPLTFGMDKTSAIVLFLAALGGVAFGGSVSAILINVPGTAANAATLFDGHPMAQQGRTAEAIGISATASALGALFGVVVLISLIPIMREIILMFGLADFFWLAILGLTVIAAASTGHLTKGLISGGLGIFIGLIGWHTLTGQYRYGFGTQYLWDGVQLIPMVVGLFAISEMINLGKKGGSILPDELSVSTDIKGSWPGIKHVLTSPKEFSISATIGTIVGIVPGAGGAIANFVSYQVAKSLSSDPSKFGKGEPTGVLAPEAANDAKDGGALIPTLLLGIPGSGAMVVLLGGLVMHGVRPGRSLITDELSMMMIILAALLFANVLTSLCGLIITPYLVKFTQLRAKLYIPVVLAISFIGAFIPRSLVLDMVSAFVIGIMAFLLMSYNFSRIALLLGYILGPMAERSFVLGYESADQSFTIFFDGIITILLVGFVIISILIPVFQQRKIKSDREDKNSFSDQIANASREKLFFEILFIGILGIGTLILLIMTIEYTDYRNYLFPYLVGGTVVILIAILGIRKVRQFLAFEESGNTQYLRLGDDQKKTLSPIMWVVLSIVAILLGGFYLGLIFYLLLYYRYRANLSWNQTGLAAVVLLTTIHLFIIYLDVPVHTGMIIEFGNSLYFG